MTVVTVRAVPIEAPTDGNVEAEAVDLLFLGDSGGKVLYGFVDHLSGIHNQRAKSR